MMPTPLFYSLKTCRENTLSRFRALKMLKYYPCFCCQPSGGELLTDLCHVPACIQADYRLLRSHRLTAGLRLLTASLVSSCFPRVAQKDHYKGATFNLIQCFSCEILS